MPRSDASELVRIEVLLPPDLAAALRKAVGKRGLSPFVAEAIARRLKVPYEAPKLGRPKGEGEK